MGERQDPPEQVKVNASAVFSLWWCSGGCVFCMVSYGVVAVLFSNFVTFSPPLSKKHVPNVYGGELSSRNVSNTLVQETFSTETCPRNVVKNVFKKSVQQIIDGRERHQTRDD